MTDKPCCEDIGFQHLWDHDPTREMYQLSISIDGVAHPTHTTRRCQNCGKVEKWTLLRPAVPAIWDWLEVTPDANG